MKRYTIAMFILICMYVCSVIAEHIWDIYALSFVSTVLLIASLIVTNKVISMHKEQKRVKHDDTTL